MQNALLSNREVVNTSLDPVNDLTGICERSRWIGADSSATIPVPEFVGRPHRLAYQTPSRRMVRGSATAIGFMPRSRAVHRIYNIAIVSVLILMVLPLLVVIGALLLVTQGRPIFYTGSRIAEGGGRFEIIKFRTLDSNKAKELTSDRVLASGTGIETPVGLFLRETRLDELPQLFNVLIGDMNLCGPRPVRPEIALLNSAIIPGYDVRFRVKPGLVGPTQALLNHGTSKVIRSRLNNHFCRAPLSYRAELTLIATVAACVMARTVSLLTRQLTPAAWRKPSGVVVQPNGASMLRFVGESGAELPVRWIDGEHIEFDNVNASEVPSAGRLIMALPGGGFRSARISLPHAHRSAAHRHHYRPENDFSAHILSRYLFQKVVVPHKSEFLGQRFVRALSRR